MSVRNQVRTSNGNYQDIVSIQPVGSSGTDRSSNQPTLPNVGSNFGVSGPYANYVLVKTIAANPDRNSINIENLTGQALVLLRDDGTAATGAAPVNPSIVVLRGGTTAGLPGESAKSSTFKGRLQIYAPNVLTGNAFITAMED